MLKYLAATAKVAPAGRKGPLVVIGNESGDMDSICSAVVGAYLYNCAFNRTTVPLFNIPRSDFRLRSDIQWLFDSVGIDTNGILFKEDVNFTSDTPLFLVDHNFPIVKGSVEAVVDHHDIEGSQSENADPYIREKSGSCMSLIIDYFCRHVPETVFTDEVLVKLALAPILLDTQNLTQKVEPVDTAIASFLQKKAPKLESGELFTTARQMKKSTKGFTALELLKKDYKQWGALGISSLPVTFEKLLTEFPDLPAAMKQWKAERNLDVCVAMTNGKVKGTWKRQLAIVKPPFDVVESFPSLEFVFKQEIDGVLFFNQKNLSASRKQVAPAFREFLKI